MEIGVRNGFSLALSQARSVGIDPAFAISAELNGDIALFRTSSDEYFNRPDPLAVTDGRPFDLAFIDGLHLFEFAFRDFINTERHCSGKSMIVFDDVLPRNVAQAARVRHTQGWTGDVYPILQVLARYRPELIVIPVQTLPTGLLLVMGLDPENSVLTDNYDEIVKEFRHADPQPVPPSLLDRLSILAPQRVLDADFWSILADASPEASPVAIRAELGRNLAASLGHAFAPGA